RCIMAARSTVSTRSRRTTMARLTGGGILGNKNVKVGVKAGPAHTNVMSPAGASQLGTAMANRKSVEALQRGTAGQVPLGNAVATNVGAGGPGTGRTTYASGSQGTHGSVDRGEPRPAGRDILDEFGPNKRGA